MSMELWILSDRCLVTIDEWQRAIDAEGFSLRLSDEVSLNTMNGFLPSHLRGKLTGFECGGCDANAVRDDHPGIDFGHDWKYALALRWLGSRRDEMQAAWMAATAYTRATDGVVFDELDGKVRTRRKRWRSCATLKRTISTSPMRP